MISVQQIYKEFDGEKLLKGVSFEVGPGEKVSLIGPGGCGKTTLLKIILGLIRPDAGVASIFGEDLARISSRRSQDVMRRVGMAFQQGGLFDFMTVGDNLGFAMEHMTDMTPLQMDAMIDDLLAGVKLGRTRALFPHELSGGMKRRVGIARALCTNPSIAMFDEPTAGLDPVTSTIILDMIHQLGGRNPKAALLVATSNVEIAIRFARRVIVINDGQVVADGPWQQLLVESTPWVKNFLGVRLIGLDIEYAHELQLPESFITEHWHLPQRVTGVEF